MRNRDRGQNEKSCIVSDEANIAAPRFAAPANVAVPATQMAWCRTPGQTGDGASLGPGQIFQVLPDRLLVLQVVMLLHQAVEQRFVARSPHLLQHDWPEFFEN